jgi:hypothetical protein
MMFPIDKEAYETLGPAILNRPGFRECLIALASHRFSKEQVRQHLRPGGLTPPIGRIMPAFSGNGAGAPVIPAAGTV